MRVLVTGGAGYVGCHAVDALLRAGHEVRVYDNLELGHAGAVPLGLLIEGDLAEGDKLSDVLSEQRIDAVMHFAAYSTVGESVTDPGRYWHNNVLGTLSLLDAMRATNVRSLVFSSTCATYGVPKKSPIAESTPQDPVNPYGMSKLTIERALADYASAYGLGYAALRYFNACGASPDGAHGEDHSPESHLIPRLLRASLEGGEKFRLFGDDWSTADGSCVRDYVHVDDLAAAHQATLLACRDGQGRVYNVGTGRGHSVLEVIRSVERVTGSPVPCETAPRREGDVARLVACPDRLRQELAWEPAWRDLDSMVETAWAWHQRHPDGYGD